MLYCAVGNVGFMRTLTWINARNVKWMSAALGVVMCKIDPSYQIISKFISFVLGMLDFTLNFHALPADCLEFLDSIILLVSEFVIFTICGNPFFLGFKDVALSSFWAGVKRHAQVSNLAAVSLTMMMGQTKLPGRFHRVMAVVCTEIFVGNGIC